MPFWKLKKSNIHILKKDRPKNTERRKSWFRYNLTFSTIFSICDECCWKWNIIRSFQKVFWVWNKPLDYQVATTFLDILQKEFLWNLEVWKNPILQPKLSYVAVSIIWVCEVTIFDCDTWIPWLMSNVTFKMWHLLGVVK